VASAIQYFLKFWRTLDLDIKTRRRQELLVLDRQRRRTAKAVRRGTSPVGND
jgi:hypothetical protein